MRTERVRDLLRAEGLDANFQGMGRGATIADALRAIAEKAPSVSTFGWCRHATKLAMVGPTGPPNDTMAPFCGVHRD